MVVVASCPHTILLHKGGLSLSIAIIHKRQRFISGHSMWKAVVKICEKCRFAMPLFENVVSIGIYILVLG